MAIAWRVSEDVDDTELVRRIGERRQDALAEVYRRHSGAVFALAQRITRNQTLAEEITQEIFVRLWNRWESYDPDRGSVRSFLLAHTHGRSVDLIRSESSRRMREERETRQLVAAAGPTLEEEVVEMQMAEHVRGALASLHEAERSAIELAYFGGHSYREVAEILGEPEGTVKSRIRSGLKRLASSLRDMGLEP
jgi:RNA polymerase sigma-70 factor (ECF subfamily)